MSCLTRINHHLLLVNFMMSLLHNSFQSSQTNCLQSSITAFCSFLFFSFIKSILLIENLNFITSKFVYQIVRSVTYPFERSACWIRQVWFILIHLLCWTLIISWRVARQHWVRSTIDPMESSAIILKSAFKLFKIDCQARVQPLIVNRTLFGVQQSFTSSLKLTKFRRFETVAFVRMKL